MIPPIIRVLLTGVVVIQLNLCGMAKEPADLELAKAGRIVEIKKLLIEPVTDTLVRSNFLVIDHDQDEIKFEKIPKGWKRDPEQQSLIERSKAGGATIDVSVYLSTHPVLRDIRKGLSAHTIFIDSRFGVGRPVIDLGDRVISYFPWKGGGDALREFRQWKVGSK